MPKHYKTSLFERESLLSHENLDNNWTSYRYIDSGFNDSLESIDYIYNLEKNIASVSTNISLIVNN